MNECKLYPSFCEQKFFKKEIEDPKFEHSKINKYMELDELKEKILLKRRPDVKHLFITTFAVYLGR